MKALLVTDQNYESQALREAFELSDFEVELQSSALFALTLIERNCPDVVVCSGFLSDMDSLDFFELLRADPKLSLVPVVLISSLQPQTVGEFDAVLPADSRMTEVVRSAYKMILEMTRRTYELPAAAIKPRSSISGQLSDMSLFELAQWLAKSAKTGRLTIDLFGESGTWLFSKGQLIHAAFNGQSGEDAVLKLLLLSESRQRGRFDFEPLSEQDFSAEPITIRKSTDQLLLSVAVQMDEQGAN
ncbi:MAG: DUF4388 domain-containing protein [Meiothermus sp.]|nr:DUF4388 domain-containing protein [Meiothermus sp.]